MPLQDKPRGPGSWVEQVQREPPSWVLQGQGVRGVKLFVKIWGNLYIRLLFLPYRWRHRSAVDSHAKPITYRRRYRSQACRDCRTNVTPPVCQCGNSDCQYVEQRLTYPQHQQQCFLEEERHSHRTFDDISA